MPPALLPLGWGCSIARKPLAPWDLLGPWRGILFPCSISRGEGPSVRNTGPLAGVLSPRFEKGVLKHLPGCGVQVGMVQNGAPLSPL